MTAPTYWVNSDGLTVRFGPHEAFDNTASQVVTAGAEQMLVMDITASTIGATAAPGDIANSAMIPANSYVISAVLIANTDWASDGSAVLDVGFCDKDGTDLNDDALIAGLAVASITADSVTAGAGASVGAVVTANSFVYATYDTAAFTAGDGRLVIRYIKQPDLF